MKALIFGGADIKDYSFCRNYIDKSYIVCCDAGMNHAKNLGLKPDVIVGDFDSADKETISYFRNMGVVFKKYPCKKDETDMELGIDAAIEAGCREIVIAAGIGSRMDHTLANMQLLYALKKDGIEALLVNENNEIRLVTDKIIINGVKGDIISLIPMTQEVTGVTTKGLEYPLNNATLFFGSRLIAVSNVMLGNTAEVEIKSGLLYMMKCRD
ncbi:thiamine diphosphokinase [Lachnospiraceae bacterium NSJ-143]|nr:thiamine diphosphokinase [Lachnospiraceae bacterium NSJ-143]